MGKRSAYGFPFAVFGDDGFPFKAQIRTILENNPAGILWWGVSIYFGRKVLYDLVYYQRVMTFFEYTGFQSVKKYPGELRLIEFRDEESGKPYQFITNNFRIAASSIAEIYKQRWQFELFFKWIKQNLKIKSFLGTSENAAMSQIWVAMIHYLLIAYIKFLHGFKL